MPTTKPTPHENLLSGIRGQIARVHTSLPGKVVSYDSATQTCTVTCAVDFKYAHPDSGEPVSYSPPAIANVPVAFPGAGDWSMTWPLTAGDDVLLVFAERGLDEWKSHGGGGHQPTDVRRFDLSDAVAIPGLRSPAGAIPAEGFADDALVIRGAEIRLGSSSATEFVALKSLVETELNRIWTALATHTHPYVDSGTASTSSAPFPAITDAAGNTGADKVKAE